jgi:hypothetical protein
MVEAAIQQTARILESRGVENPEAVATSQAATATGRRLKPPAVSTKPNPMAQQFQQLILQLQAEEDIQAKEAQSAQPTA